MGYFSDWLIRTVGGRGARDAVKGYPRKTDVATVKVYNWSVPCWELNKYKNDAKPVDSGSGIQAIGEAQVAPYEQTLINLAEEGIDAEREKWEALKQKPEATATQLNHELKHLLDEYRAASQEHKAKGYRQPSPKIGKWLYLTLLALLGLLELPLNMTALQILRMGDEELVLLSSGIALMFVLLAHFIGLRFRYWPRERQHWVVYLGIFVTILAVFGSILAIGVLRAEFLAYEAGKEIEWGSSVALMALNFAYLVGGAGLSYLAHDRDEELERIVKSKQKLRKKLTRCSNKWIEVSTRFDTLLKTITVKMDRIRDDAITKISEYRDYNRRFREADDCPEYFKNEIGYFLFRPIELGHELDTHPESINDLFRRIEEEVDNA